MKKRYLYLLPIGVLLLFGAWYFSQAKTAGGESLTAKVNRSDYLNFTLAENAAQRDLREANINRRFQGNLTLSYGLNQTAATLPDAYRNPLGARFAGATFSVPILNFGKNKADAEVARYSLEAQQRQNENARNALELDVYTAVLELKQLKTSLVISAKSDTIAQKRYEVARNRYLIGKVDITNLLIAQQDKDAALLAYPHASAILDSLLSSPSVNAV